MYFSCWLVLFLSVVSVSSADLHLFFPYGSEVTGDMKLPSSDDSSISLNFTSKFVFCSKTYSKLYINNNGVISFDKPILEYFPEPLPLNEPLVAPYWSDIDTRGIGTVWYRLTNDPSTLLQVRNKVNMYFPNDGEFIADEVLVTTWDQVGYYNMKTDKVNTFQCVMATDGTRSYVMFQFPENGINWYLSDVKTTDDDTSGSNDNSSSSGSIILPQVGLNKGDGVNFVLVDDGSLTDSVVDVEKLTNVVYPSGFYMWRVSDGFISGTANCSSNNQVILTPNRGHQLGGTTVIITGPCFSDSDTIECTFDTLTVPGAVISKYEALCVSPLFNTLYITGNIDFALVINGSKISTTHFYLEHFIDKADVVMVTTGYQFLVQTNDTVQLRWNTESIFPHVPHNVYTVDIELYQLLQSAGWTKVSSFSYENQPNNGNINISITASLSGELVPILFKVSTNLNQIQSNIEDSKIQALNSTYSQSGYISAGHWSHVIVWRNSELNDYCNSWNDISHSVVSGTFEACPCSVSQAELPNSGFIPNTSPGTRLMDQFLHNVSSICYLQITTVHLQNGSFGKQKCCYDRNGALITGAPNGGYQLRHVEFLSSDWLGFFNNDIAPHIGCCITSNIHCSDIYYTARPSDNCNNFNAIESGFMYGDPHLLTLDGLKYTFNGRGEFILIETIDNILTIQGRMVPISNSEGNELLGTVFSAVVAKQSDSDTVEFQSSYNAIRALVNGEWILIDTDTPAYYMNVTIRKKGNDTYSAIFSRGAALEVKHENGYLASVIISLPDSFRGATRGLLGVFDGNTRNDFSLPNGVLLPVTGIDTETIHDQFGLSWILSNESESLFTYSTHESFSTYYKPDFVPMFQANFSDSDFESEANATCQGDLTCLFDIAATGNIAIGISTIEQIHTIETIHMLSQPTICSPPCVNGACVSNGTCNCPYGYEGELCQNIISFDCDETNPCQNNATCLIQVFTYYCTCVPPFTGIHCETIDCGPPPIVVSPLAVTYNDTVVGSIASYTCINGYVIDGYATSSRVCQDNGIWSDVNVHCIVDCGPLNTSDNTQLNVTYNSTLLGAVAYYTCLSPEEYTLVGVSYRMCTSTGQWSHQSPYCELIPTLIDCGQPQLPSEYLTVTFDGTTVGSIAIYNCPTGYVLKGDKYSVCESNGLWTLMHSQCLRDCGEPITGGDDCIRFNIHNGTVEGSLISYYCHDTCLLLHDTPLFATCLSSGVWSGSLPTCQRKADCGIPPVWSSGLSVQYNSTIAGSVAIYYCTNTDYKLSSGNETIICLDTGQWEEEQPVCRESMYDPMVYVIVGSTLAGILLFVIIVLLVITLVSVIANKVKFKAILKLNDTEYQLTEI